MLNVFKNQEKPKGGRGKDTRKLERNKQGKPKKKIETNKTSTKEWKIVKSRKK